MSSPYILVLSLEFGLPILCNTGFCIPSFIFPLRKVKMSSTESARDIFGLPVFFCTPVLDLCLQKGIYLSIAHISSDYQLMQFCIKSIFLSFKGYHHPKPEYLRITGSVYFLFIQFLSNSFPFSSFSIFLFLFLSYLFFSFCAFL